MQTKFILKNTRVTHETNEYIIFDTQSNTQTRLVDTPDTVKNIASSFGLEPISPLTAQYSGYFDFKHVKLNEFI